AMRGQEERSVQPHGQVRRTLGDAEDDARPRVGAALARARLRDPLRDDVRGVQQRGRAGELRKGGARISFEIVEQYLEDAHDWNYLLGAMHLLPFDHPIAFLIRVIATIIGAASLTFAVWLLRAMSRGR